MFRFATVFLSVVLVSGHIASAEKPAITWQRSLGTALEQSKAQKRPLLLFLTTPGCTFCERMKRQTLAQKQIVDQIQTRFVAVKLNGKSYPKVTKQLRVRMYPTTAVVESSGKVLDVIHGFKTPRDFTQRLTKAHTKRAAHLATKPESSQQKKK